MCAGGFWEGVLEGSREFWSLPEGSGGFWTVLKGSRGIWSVQESYGEFGRALEG